MFCVVRHSLKKLRIYLQYFPNSLTFSHKLRKPVIDRSHLRMHRLTNAIGTVGLPLASKALQRSVASSPVRTGKQCVRLYTTPATSVVAEPFLNGTSSTYVEEMYEAWLENPGSVHKVVAMRCVAVCTTHLQ